MKDSLKARVNEGLRAPADESDGESVVKRFCP